MSKGIPKSVSAQIAKECHLYPGDNDGMRISRWRLDAFIAKRDAAILTEIQAIRKELAEQKQMIAAIKKYGKPKLFTQAQVDEAVRAERQELRRLFDALGMQFGASAGSATGVTVRNDFGETWDFQLDRDSLSALLGRFNGQLTTPSKDNKTDKESE